MTTQTRTPIQTESLAGTRWAIDPAHTSVEFAVKHMKIATVKGRFAELTATLAVEADDLATATVVVDIDAASLDTRSEQRDEHLRSADFFDVANHPRLTFRSRSVTARGDGEYRIVGDLTIRGVTRELVLDAEFQGSGQDPWGGTRLGFTAAGRVDRRDFGLTWNAALEAGGFLVGDEVRLAIDAQFVRQ